MVTLKQLLETALLPVGSTMYVWGGGWNEEDTGAGESSTTIGVSPKWREFFSEQTEDYDFTKTKYRISMGLDCSGYIGWCIYNVMCKEDGRKGFVYKAEEVARQLAERGWGRLTAAGKMEDYRAGDIMSSAGHVWMAVGQCRDGSVVLLHSSPPGVRICGTPSYRKPDAGDAVKLAGEYMKKYYPLWYRKFPQCHCSKEYLTDYSRMRWDLSQGSVMSDPDGYKKMPAEEILEDLFKT